MSGSEDKKQKDPSLEEVMAAIPEDIIVTGKTKDMLEELITQLSTRNVPVNSFSRLWALGSMQAKIAVGYLSYALRSSFRNRTEKEKILNETHLKAALKLLGTMGYMRGAVMKVGQLLGNMPHLVPDEVIDILEKLQFEAPPMHYSLIREVFLDEFGREPQELFASFDKQAFAAASLGQVHRATLKSGEEVAVKIQYPSMAATIHSDMANMRRIVFPMKLKQEGRYLSGHLDDVESVLLGETDYRQEADFLRKAGKSFHAGDRIVVPKVWDEFSTDRVLTMDLLRGRHAPEFLKSNPAQADRNNFGTLISRAIFRLWGQARTIYADPNPGNFLLLNDNRLGLIDFGCCRTLDPDEWRFQTEAEKALMQGNIQNFEQYLAKASLFDRPDEMEPERLNLLLDMSRWQAEPAMKAGEFNFGDREFYQHGLDIYMELTRKGYMRNSSLYIWWNRLIFGHRTLLYRLGSMVDYHGIYTKESTY